MPLTKEDILAARDRSPVAVAVPEWATDDGDATAYVIGLTGDDASRLSGLDNDEAFRLACAMGLCDEHGVSLGFTPAEVMLLGEKSMSALRRVYAKVESLSGLGGDDGELAKNSASGATSGGGPSSASPTESPSES